MNDDHPVSGICPQIVEARRALEVHFQAIAAECRNDSSVFLDQRHFSDLIRILSKLTIEELNVYVISCSDLVNTSSMYSVGVDIPENIACLITKVFRSEFCRNISDAGAAEMVKQARVPAQLQLNHSEQLSSIDKALVSLLVAWKYRHLPFEDSSSELTNFHQELLNLLCLGLECETSDLQLISVVLDSLLSLDSIPLQPTLQQHSSTWGWTKLGNNASVLELRVVAKVSWFLLC